MVPGWNSFPSSVFPVKYNLAQFKNDVKLEAIKSVCFANKMG
jgi:hypothetical protein